MPARPRCCSSSARSLCAAPKALATHSSATLRTESELISAAGERQGVQTGESPSDHVAHPRPPTSPTPQTRRALPQRASPHQPGQLLAAYGEGRRRLTVCQFSYRPAPLLLSPNGLFCIAILIFHSFFCFCACSFAPPRLRFSFLYLHRAKLWRRR